MRSNLEDAELLLELKESDKSRAEMAPNKDINEIVRSLIGCKESGASEGSTKLDLDSKKFECVFRSFVNILGLQN